MTERPREADQENAWCGISCTSWLWPHTTDPAQFEIRRAIANVLPGLRDTANEDEPSLDDVMRVLAATNVTQKAVARTLSVVVAEAVARGATWRQVGEALGIGKQGAHNRFGKGLSEATKERLAMEYDTLINMRAVFEGLVSEELIGFEEEDWEAAPPEVAVQHAVRAVPSAALLLKEAVLKYMDGEDATDLFYRASEMMRGAFRTFMTARVVNFLSACVGEASVRPLWSDVQPATYFCHCIFRTVTAYSYFTNLFIFPVADEEEKCKRLILAYYNLQQASLAIARPEFIEVYAQIERKVRDGGNAVFVGSGNEGRAGVDMLEALYAYWRKDRELLSEVVGVDVSDESGVDVDLLRSLLGWSD
ncbi:hypothetical protein [Streptomyces chartreusis]|uniref:hypothetical protein n=1 Tax=Streptomyces chartreusis TaxID=1969 RepID=UPI00381A1CD2